MFNNKSPIDTLFKILDIFHYLLILGVLAFIVRGVVRLFT